MLMHVFERTRESDGGGLSQILIGGSELIEERARVMERLYNLLLIGATCHLSDGLGLPEFVDIAELHRSYAAAVASANRLPNGMKIFDSSPDEGIKTGIKFPLYLAHRLLSAEGPNTETSSPQVYTQNILNMIRSPGFEPTLLRLSNTSNGVLGSVSSNGMFDEYYKTNIQIDLGMDSLAKLDEEGHVYVPHSTRKYLGSNLKAKQADALYQVDGCPMRRRNGSDDSLIVYASRRVADCLDILCAAAIEGFTPHSAKNDTLFGSDLKGRQ